MARIDVNVDQFEKKAEAVPTAVFYNEAGEEVERVLLEGLSRCHDVDDVDDDENNENGEDGDDIGATRWRGSC